MPALLERASRLALDLLYPPQCAICRAHGSRLCILCEAVLPLAEEPRCDVCWDDVKTGPVCDHCLSLPPPFASIRAPFTHEGDARTLVHLLKYDGLSSLAAPLAGLMVPVVDVSGVDLVVPIPLHPSRERSRGYNQAALLARHISREAGLELHLRATRRVRKTKPLAQSMDRDERRSIVAGAFAADGALVAGRSVLVVDDVVTTGATLGACATALLDAGAVCVHAVTFTRA